MITLAVDNFQKNTGRPLPNGLTPAQCVDDDFATRSPWLDYPRLYYYLKESNIPCQIKNTPEAENNSWYPMTIGWFCHSLDYFTLLPKETLARLKAGELKLVMLYHEADNPQLISERLLLLCKRHAINFYNVFFISGNSVANNSPQCLYWPELEYMFNRSVDHSNSGSIHNVRRYKNFTALCRIDKLWRKLFMSNLWDKGLDTNGYFSYCQEFLGEQDDWDGVPLLNEFLNDRKEIVDSFIDAGPFFVDDLTTEQRNNYSIQMPALYDNSYFNFVLETFIDVDSSGGQFITEKTLKPILHCQPFIVVAEAHHLRHLKELGYRTFGHVIDESYDEITNTQKRFEQVMKLSEKIASMELEELHEIYLQCKPELVWNKMMLENTSKVRLMELVTKIDSEAEV